MDVHLPYGSFTLKQTDSDTDSDSDLKPNGYIVQTQTRIPTPYFCTRRQESKSVSVSETISGNVNESLYLMLNSCHAVLMILVFK